MKKNYFGAYVHLALLVLLVGVSFSACNKSEKFATQPNHNNLSGVNAAIINQVIPNGSTTVSFDSVSKNDEAALTKMEATNTIIILNHGISTNADKKFIRSVVINHSIPIILDGEAALNNNTISGISNIPGNSIALLYNRIGHGITTEIFNDKRFGTSKTISVKPTLDPKRLVLTPSQKAEITKEGLQKNPSLNIDSAWREYNKNVAALLAQRTKNDTTAVSEEKIPDVPLTSQVEEMKSRFSECLSNVYKKQNNNLAGSARAADVTSPCAHVLDDVTKPDLSNCKIRANVFDFFEVGSSYKSTLNNNGIPSIPKNSFIPFSYRVFITVAEGTYSSQEELRTFVNVTFVGNPGVTAMVQDGDNKRLPDDTGPTYVLQKSILNTMMKLFQPEIDFPGSFDYDRYEPKASSSSTGTFSGNSTFTFNLSPLSTAPSAGGSYSLGTSYSYSMPDFGFTNQTDKNTTRLPNETVAYRITQWPWQPGACIGGAFNNGAGMLYSFIWTGSNVFYPASQAPIPMNQTNNIQADVSFSRAYDGNNFNLYCFITTSQINAVGASPLWASIGGWPYLDGYYESKKIAQLSGSIQTSFPTP